MPKRLDAPLADEPPDDPCQDPVGTFQHLVVALRDLYDAGEFDAVRKRIDAPPGAGPHESGVKPLPSKHPWLGPDSLVGRQLTVDFRSWRRCAADLGQDERLYDAVLQTYTDETRRLLEPIWSGFLSEFGGCREASLQARLQKIESMRSEIAWSGGERVDAVTGQTLPEILNASCTGLLLSARCPDDGLRARVFEVLSGLGGLFTGLDQVTFYTSLAMAFPWSPEMAGMTLGLLSDPDTAWSGIEVLWVSQLDGDIGVDEIRGLFASLPGLSARLLSPGSGTVGPTAVLLAACGNWGDQQLGEYLRTEPANLATIVGFLGFSNAPGRTLASITAFTKHADPAVRAAGWRAIGARAQSDPEAFEWLKNWMESSTHADETYRGAVEGLVASALPEATQLLGSTIMNKGLPAAMKAEAVRGYSLLPDADLEVLESIARAGDSEDEDVRAQAVVGRFSRSQDLEEGVRFLTDLVDDPSFRISGLSSAVLETYYGKIRVEGPEHDAWVARSKPAGYTLYSLMDPEELSGLFAFYAAPEHQQKATMLGNLSRQLGPDGPGSQVRAAAFLAQALAQLATAATEEDSL